MKLSILHISDLHRDPKNPIGNSALIASLENDRRHFTSEEVPRIQSPDLIVVSGDIIQGVNPADPEFEPKLIAQYAEALYFLNEITNRFLNGDKRRIVVVPGNHDVSAPHFINSLSRVDILPDRKKDLVTQLFSRNSLLRWSWSDFELYAIDKPDVYAQRLAAFCGFYAQFYDGARSYSIEPEKQYDIFDFPDFNLTLVGFCSCFNNDLFNKQGDIHPDCISAAALQLRHNNYDNRVRIAVWHHNTEGVPLQFDYMDPDILQNLIDQGFSIGLHGHQHKPQFLDTRFRHGNDRRLSVISAGTLCGGASYRFARAYNVIELDTELRTGLLHVREMKNDHLLLPIWGRRALQTDISSALDFSYDPPLQPPARAEVATIALLEAQRLYDNGEYGKAATKLQSMAASDGLARRLLLDCLIQLHDNAGIRSIFDPPGSAAEAIHLMDALWDDGKRQRLRQLLSEEIIADSTDSSVIEMREKFLARLQK